MIQVSVIIPTYKPDSYLFECIDCVFKQNLDDSKYEILIILNGPKEPYYKSIEDFIKSSSLTNIKLYYEVTPNVSNARNRGISIAKGNYAAFIDDDDLITPNYLSALLAISSADSISLSNVKTFSKSLENTSSDYITHSFLKNKKRGKTTLISLKSCLVTVWGKLIPFNLIGNYRFDSNFSKGEDHLFIAALSKNVKYYNLSSTDTIYFRRIRENSATRNIVSIVEEFRIYRSLFIAYLKVYFSAPLKYNPLFFLIRELAMTKAFYLISLTFFRKLSKKQ